MTEMLKRSCGRKLFGAALNELQLIQASLGGNAAEIDASALLTYRAAWAKDSGRDRVTSEAAIAKMYVTEAAQRVIDRVVQAHGSLGVTKGIKVEGTLS